jgi:hypothetical protein
MSVPSAGVTFGKGTILEFPVLRREFNLDSRLGHVFWGCLQGQSCTPILQAYDLEGVGSANGDRTRIRRLLLFAISY